MKPFLITAALAACMACGSNIATAQPSHVQTDKIAQIKEGNITTARASWWGFDKEDATEALQNAINSGVPQLIVDNMGSDWIVNRPIRLHSDQKIIFEDGVVVQAKKGYFKALTDSLFIAANKSNFKLTGQGKVAFRMQRADYDNPQLYKKAEWRSGIDLRECENVEIRNITVEETGGDGLYLGSSANGYNKNILVENCQFINNYRQGISVISAENLTIRHCKLNNTAGTSPQAGIDFEPNNAGQRLVNCVLENCDLIGNKGAGLDIYAVHLRGTSKPLSITLENCRISGNSIGMTASTASYPDNLLSGKVLLKNCVFDNSDIKITNPILKGVEYIFENCTLDFSKSAEIVTPISLNLALNMESHRIGNIAFDRTTIKSPKSDPIKITVQGNGTLSDQVSGTLLIDDAEKTQPFDLPAFIKREQARIAKERASKQSIAEALNQRTANLHRLKAGQVPQIDGKLDEEIYTQLPWSEEFVGLLDRQKYAPPQVRTHAFVAYDSNNLYIAVRGDEPNMAAQKISGKKHDSNVWRGENIDIAILKPGESTDDVSASYYHFILNPDNVQWDAINTGTSTALDYNPKWQSATSRNSDNWTAEIAIPWKEIGVAEIRKKMRIHANIARYRMIEKAEYSSWSQYVSGFQEPQHLGTWILGK